MKHLIILYAATLLVMVPLDFVWLGSIARGFYSSRIGALMEIHTGPAILFYLVYAAGIVVFAGGNEAARLQPVLLYGALFGFFAYSTYDLTNMATLRGWSWPLVVVDIVWGTFITSVAAAGGWLIAGFFRP